MSATDEAALKWAFHLSEIEGIIPALETAHAFAVLPEMNLKPSDIVIVCLSGRGDKDLATYMQAMDLK
jgi:tryptophan synthase beta chain